MSPLQGLMLAWRPSWGVAPGCHISPLWGCGVVTDTRTPPSLPRGLLVVAAEGVAHGGQQLVGEVGLAARAETFVEGAGQHRGRHRLVDGGLDGPAAFAGVGDAA